MTAYFRGEEGTSLVEVLVALMVFALTAISFTALFVSSYATVQIAGYKSESLQTVYADVEKQIDGFVSGSGDTVTVVFSGTSIIVKGTHITESNTSPDGRSVQLEVFLPEVPFEP